MTERELCQKFDIHIHIFDGDELEDSDEAFYIADLRTVFVSSHIAQKDRVRYILHELGHRGQLPHLYEVFREKYELQANRNMIHHLLKAELDDYDDHSSFNYLTFMEKYKLKTVAEEVMVLEEYRNLTNVG